MGRKTSYSVTEAKNHLPKIVRGLAKCPVEITKRGRPAAWLISDEDFKRLTSGKKGFVASLREIGAVDIPLGDRAMDGSNPWK